MWDIVKGVRDMCWLAAEQPLLTYQRRPILLPLLQIFLLIPLRVGEWRGREEGKAGASCLVVLCLMDAAIRMPQ